MYYCRLVSRLPAGLGSFPHAGPPQHADGLSGVVALWGCRIPGRHHQWGRVGVSLCGLRAGCHRLHGNFSLLLFFFFFFFFTLKCSEDHYNNSFQYQHGNTLMSLVIAFILVAQFPMGFSVATSVRVGNALGAGSTEQAKLSSKVSLVCTGVSRVSEPEPLFCCGCCLFSSFLIIFTSSARCCFNVMPCILMPDPAAFSLFIGTCLGLSKDVIGYIFTTDEWVKVSTPVYHYCYLLYRLGDNI